MNMNGKMNMTIGRATLLWVFSMLLAGMVTYFSTRIQDVHDHATFEQRMDGIDQRDERLERDIRRIDGKLDRILEALLERRKKP